MTVQITIIGLGQIGASAGLALAEHTDRLRRVGHDRDPKVAQKAQKMGALDAVQYNLRSAVRDADIVLLALPFDQVRDTLEVIAPDLKESAVVMDTSPVKGAVAAWAKELFPAERFFIGVTPVINPSYLYESGRGIDSAHADLFLKGMMAIAAPPGTDSEAVKLTTDLTRLLGAEPLYVDLAEVDSLMAAIHLLPQLTAAALLNVTVDQPGWREARKLAGHVYAEATATIAHQDESAALVEATRANRENVLRVLDSVIAALQALRAGVAAEDAETLAGLLERAREGRLRWLKERNSGDWLSIEFGKADMPTVSDLLKQTFMGERKKKK